MQPSLFRDFLTSYGTLVIEDAASLVRIKEHDSNFIMRILIVGACVPSAFLFWQRCLDGWAEGQGMRALFGALLYTGICLYALFSTHDKIYLDRKSQTLIHVIDCVWPVHRVRFFDLRDVYKLQVRRKRLGNTPAARHQLWLVLKQPRRKARKHVRILSTFDKNHARKAAELIRAEI